MKLRIRLLANDIYLYKGMWVVICMCNKNNAKIKLF